MTNEIFRRVEPNGKTLGEYLKSNLRKQFGFDCIIGAQEEDFALIHNYTS
jgi:hypothetical protein